MLHTQASKYEAIIERYYIRGRICRVPFVLAFFFFYYLSWKHIYLFTMPIRYFMRISARNGQKKYAYVVDGFILLATQSRIHPMEWSPSG